jgi:hypothetical protein
MGIEFEFHLDLDRLIRAEEAATPEAIAKGLEHIRGVAVERTPVDTGNLAGSAAVHVDGSEGSITYDGPYARYQHERLDLRHETGQAKFLESSLMEEGGKAFEIIATDIKRAL